MVWKLLKMNTTVVGKRANNMTKQERVIVKYNLQKALYDKLCDNDFMSSQYNSNLLKHIWTLSIKDLRTALK